MPLLTVASSTSLRVRPRTVGVEEGGKEECLRRRNREDYGGRFDFRGNGDDDSHSLEDRMLVTGMTTGITGRSIAAMWTSIHGCVRVIKQAGRLEWQQGLEGGAASWSVPYLSSAGAHDVV